jgi:signal transduction histidine kinase
MRGIAPVPAQRRGMITPSSCARIPLAGWAALLAAALLPLASPAAPTPARGLPFSRFYSFEEIGNASRGARLGFDEVGRLAVTNAGCYLVLNDTAWLDRADKEAVTPAMQRIVFGPDGQAYYCAFGSWGTVEQSPQRLLRPHPLRPKSRPAWTLSSNFSEILVVGDAVYFGGYNGVVYWNRATDDFLFLEVPEVSRIFALGEKVFVSSHRFGIQLVDVPQRRLTPVIAGQGEATCVDQVTALDAGRALVSMMDRRLLQFDGQQLLPWSGSLGEQTVTRVSGLQRLADGSVAVALSGQGLYRLTAQGDLIAAFTTPEYHRITDLATREPGVLWLATESGVEKLLYESALTVFGQRLGLPVSWPQVVSWRDRIVVASGGRLYETMPASSPGAGQLPETSRFQLVPDQPAEEVWGLAAHDNQLLIGTSAGVFARKADGHFESILPGINVARLVVTGGDLCYVIGLYEITALRFRDGRWSECTARVPGVGYPAVVHASAEAAWIELGANRVARLSVRGTQLHARVLDQFPWADPRWINVGIVDDKVILSGMPAGRVYFDEKQETFTAAPALDQMLRRIPQPITRLKQDDTGVIWAAYDRGLLRIDPKPDGYEVRPESFGRIQDRFPNILLLPGGDVWLGTAQSLYHVDPHLASLPPPRFQPMLVSMIDTRTNRELLAPHPPAKLTYAENSLALRFFAGGYASRQPLGYEYVLHRGDNHWRPANSGSLLTLTDLREGDYRLEVRIAGQEPQAEPLLFSFTINPPLYRTWYAYALYVLGGTAVVLGVVRWSEHRTRARNVVLENLVSHRTDELRVAMQQLNEETRNAATLAERDRLAGEIHDSLQQGLSGLMLHLDATLKLANLPEDVRTRLGTARNMVSFTRHEVQHAVWDMETPLLQDTELGEALRKLVALISPGGARAEVTVTGQPVELPSATKHHLLRIAQEAITNAVRHAAARTIAIHLAYDASSLTLRITDDGRGFVPSAMLAGGIGHFGLRGLRGRAGKIGGDLQIDSAPGRGTTVLVTVQHSHPAYAHDR